MSQQFWANALKNTYFDNRLKNPRHSYLSPVRVVCVCLCTRITSRGPLRRVIEHSLAPTPLENNAWPRKVGNTSVGLHDKTSPPEVGSLSMLAMLSNYSLSIHSLSSFVQNQGQWISPLHSGSGRLCPRSHLKHSANAFDTGCPSIWSRGACQTAGREGGVDWFLDAL